jgi:hypothetical protein
MNDTTSTSRLRVFDHRRMARALQIALCCAGLVIGASGAFATPSAGFASTVVGPTAFEDLDVKLHGDALKVKIQTHGLADAYVVTNIVVPGGHSGWHTHPGPSLVSVKSGTATYYDGDDPRCTPHIIKQGEGFVDPGGGHLHLVRNETAENLELVAFQMIPLGAMRRIDVAHPGNCPF